MNCNNSCLKQSFAEEEGYRLESSWIISTVMKQRLTRADQSWREASSPQTIHSHKLVVPLLCCLFTRDIPLKFYHLIQLVYSCIYTYISYILSFSCNYNLTSYLHVVTISNWTDFSVRKVAPGPLLFILVVFVVLYFQSWIQLFYRNMNYVERLKSKKIWFRYYWIR